MSRFLALCLVCILAACMPWSQDLGSIELPAMTTAPDEVQPRALPLRSTSSLEDALQDLRSREPAPKGEPPRAIGAVGDEIVPLSIAEVRALALRNNLDLEVALYEPEIAAARVGAEVGRFDLLIGSRFRFQQKDTPPLDGPLVDFSSGDPVLDGQRAKLTEVAQRRQRLGLGLDFSLPLPTGGALQLETLVDEKTVTDPQRFEQYLAGTRFSFSQPLLRNAGPDVSLAAIRVARTNARISEVRTKLSALRVLSGAEKSYWRLYAARRILDVRSQQYRLARGNLDLVKRRVEEGLTPRVEIVRAEVGVYSRLEALVVAETAWRLQQRELKAFLASDRFPLEGKNAIEVSSTPLLAGLELQSDVLVERALEERLDLIEIELRILRDGLEVAVAENRVLPIVNLDFHYGVLARDGSLGRAWESQWGFDDPDFGMELSFKMPLSNQRPREQLREISLRRSERLATLRARELKVRTEVLNSVDVISRNWQRIVAARQNVIVAGVNYDAEKRQFAQGLRTMREVLESLDDLGAAQLREIRAIVEYQVAQIDLAFATGTLLGYAGVEIEALRLPRR